MLLTEQFLSSLSMIRRTGLQSWDCSSDVGCDEARQMCFPFTEPKPLITLQSTYKRQAFSLKISRSVESHLSNDEVSRKLMIKWHFINRQSKLYLMSIDDNEQSHSVFSNIKVQLFAVGFYFRALNNIKLILMSLIILAHLMVSLRWKFHSPRPLGPKHGARKKQTVWWWKLEQRLMLNSFLSRKKWNDLV